jgi:hypothetical protein
LIVLENGTTYSLLGTSSNGRLTPSEAQVGTLSVSGSAATGSGKGYIRISTEVIDSVNLTFSGKVVTNFAITGTTTNTAGTTVAAGTSTQDLGVPSTASYDYNTAAALATVAGVWPVTSYDGNTGTLTINSNGTVSGLAGGVGGCASTGTIAPRSSGKNVYDFVFTSGAAPCSPANVTYTGVAVYSLNSTDTSKKQLAYVGQTSDKVYVGAGNSQK